MLDRADEMGKDLSSLHAGRWCRAARCFRRCAANIAARGVSVLQCYATAEFGVIAYESAAADGTPNPGMVVNENLIVEIVRPGTGDPVPDGEVGEVVVTGFNPAYPLVRLGTGDLSAIMPGASPCGRSNQRIVGWRGRADQRTKVKGMFVDPQPGRRDRAAGIRRSPRRRLVVARDGERDVDGAACRAGGSRRTGRRRDRGDAARGDEAFRRRWWRPNRAACPMTAR